MKFKKITTKTQSGWSDWENPVMTGYQMACCDCGLVHTMNFRVIKIIKKYKNGFRDVKEMPKGEYQVILKAKRHKKFTKELRKKDGITITH